MISTSLKPSVDTQLWLWARELADYADEIEWRAEGSHSWLAGIREES